MQTLISKPIVSQIEQATKKMVVKMVDEGLDPQLAVILVGNRPDSLTYVDMKTRKAKEMGIILSLYHLGENSSYEEIAETIQFLNEDTDIHSVIIQLPLPSHISQEQTNQLLNLVSKEKDVDGLRGDWQTIKAWPTSLAGLLGGRELFLPPMVCSVLALLSYYQISLSGQKIVLVGKGRLVGQPLLSFMQSLGLDVTAVDEETSDILTITTSADILICGTGEPDLITYQWIKEGAVVIDCAKDVHFDSVSQLASSISPAIGGIGPLTVSWLLNNAAQAAHNSWKAK